jgi:hypothetical protein
MTDDQQPTPPAASRWSWQFGVAVLILLGFGVLVIFMIQFADTTQDPVWQRRIYVFSAVEALVFTAVGWLFGREVNRAAVVTAQQDAAGAKKEAGEARTEAKEQATAAATERAKGHAIAAVAAHSVPAASAQRSAGSQDAAAGGAGTGSGTAMTVDLRALMMELYPDQ